MTSGQGAGGQQGATAAAAAAAGGESQGQQGGAPASASAPSGPGSWCVGCKVTLSTTLGEVSSKPQARQRDGARETGDLDAKPQDRPPLAREI